MHEYSLLTDLMRKVNLVAHDNPGMAAVEVKIRLGARCGISSAALKKEFKTFTRGTVAEDAVLSIECANNQNDPWAEDILLKGVEFERTHHHARP
jgi:Zn finger protein HypA/HybF involved in hydrogenase expression